MRAMQQGADQPREPEPPRDLGRPRTDTDPLTIALIVFFVGLIVIVAILLIVPMLAR
jgi:hypothetical protein